jgi:hypothetical protein
MGFTHEVSVYHGNTLLVTNKLNYDEDGYSHPRSKCNYALVVDDEKYFGEEICVKIASDENYVTFVLCTENFKHVRLETCHDEQHFYITLPEKNTVIMFLENVYLEHMQMMPTEECEYYSLSIKNPTRLMIEKTYFKHSYQVLVDTKYLKVNEVIVGRQLM